MLENRPQKCPGHRSLDVDRGEQRFKVNREVSVSLEANSLERRGHYRLRAPANFLVQRFLVRHTGEASLIQELGIFNAAGIGRRSEYVTRGSALIQLEELVIA